MSFDDDGVRMTATASSEIEIEQALTPTGRPSQRGEPTWELARQFPWQGEWTVVEYLARHFEGLVEFVDGRLEFLPMVTRRHQDLLEMLYDLLRDFTRRTKFPGKPYFAPLRIRVTSTRFREPDLCLPGPQDLGEADGPLLGARLVMEIVSGSKVDRERDLIEKRRDYAVAQIPEYWIVDPETETITVLTLPAGETEYIVHGEFRPGQIATSKLLDGLTVDVTACFSAGKGNGG